MNRRQLFKKIAGIAGAVLAAPVMAKEASCLNGDPLDANIPPFYLDPYNPGSGKKPIVGQVCYFPNGIWATWNGKVWVGRGQYDTLDGQHASYYTSTH